ncbi:glycosyltransferase family 4 protein [Sphingobacterium corticibacterium]|nr:glycosyltransferase family 4 protein [Sphingobacterium corticibacterium]
MKIVYCINNTWYAGGMTRVLANKANYLAAQGYEVVVITTDQGGHIPHYPLSEKIQQIDLGINYLGADRKGTAAKIIYTLCGLWQHKQKLRKLLKELKADTVVSMFTREMFVLPGIQDGSKKVLEIHTSRYNWLRLRKNKGIIGKLQNVLDFYTVKRFDHFVVLTEQDEVFWRGIKHISVIPNANSFEPKESSALDQKTVLAVGRCDEGKNFKDIIEAWAIIQPIHPDWRLKIIGDGELRGSLKKQTERLRLDSSVMLQPYTRDIVSEYLNSSVFVLSSIYEGLGMVLLEAQSCGVPLVAYDCQCGPREIIVEGENGFLVDVGDVDALANRIIRLIENEPLRVKMGQAAKENSKRFSEKIIMQKWLDLFHQLQKGRDNWWG